MIIANRTLSIIDTAFTAIEQIERFDYVAVGETVINIIATTAAIIYGVASYIITACQLYWETHGQSIITNAVRFTFIITDTIGATYIAGRKLRPLVNHWVARLTDTLFYVITA